MNTNLNNLILTITKHVVMREGHITKTKLLKLLYLFDVEFYRLHREIFTGLNWKFYHLGPWSNEYDIALASLVTNDLLEKDTSSRGGHETEFYKAVRAPKIEEFLSDLTDQFTLKTVLEDWGDKKTAEILDYVYFKTEPMIYGERNQPLNFSSIPEGAPVIYRRSSSGASQAQIEAKRKQIAEMLQKTKKQSKPSLPPPRYDDVYWEAIDTLEELAQ